MHVQEGWCQAQATDHAIGEQVPVFWLQDGMTVDQPYCPMPGRPVPDSPAELGSGTARMAMEGSAMAIDAPGSGARGSRDDAWAGYVALVPPPLTIDH